MNTKPNPDLNVTEIDHETHGKVVIIQCVEGVFHNLITSYLDQYNVTLIRKVVTGNNIALHYQGYPLIQIENMLEKMIRDLSKLTKKNVKMVA